MKQSIDKFISIEKELSEEKGEFNLFALFLREDAANKWDLLVSADWINENKSDSLNLISKKLQSNLEKKDLVQLSRIVLIEEDNPGLTAFHNSVNIEHGSVEIQDSNFFGLEIKHAYVITSKRATAEAE